MLFWVYPVNFLDHKQVGIYLPCYDIFRNWIEDFTRSNAPGLTPYAPLVAGSVARSLACIACSPIELARTRMQVHLHLECFIGFRMQSIHLRSLFLGTNYSCVSNGHYSVVTGL